MSAKTILEAVARISAIDATGKVFAQIGDRIKGLGKLGQQIQAIQGADKALSSYRGITSEMRKQLDLATRTSRAIKAQEGRAALRDAGKGAVIAAGYAAKRFGKDSLKTYREFDNERRYGKAVMGLTDEQQKPLVDQAIHMGATTKFNDIQVLETQRALASRGLDIKQVMALTQVAASLGSAMDKTLPEAAKMLEGAIFGFGKDTSTFAAAVASAERTADLQVKGSKISGMDAEDIQQLYKFGANPFKQAGLSEERLLAFGALGKKANIGGDEMGTAARALVANLLSPTGKARTALSAAGINYSDYQKNPEKMDARQFARSVAESYGVKLGDDVVAKIQTVFNNKELTGDTAKFMPAITSLLKESLGGNDAKSLKSISGKARAYRDASSGGIDANRLFDAVMMAMRLNAPLANLVFGSKQGGRISTALGTDEFDKKLKDLIENSKGYANSIAEQRMSGFDGAVSRFEGAVKNLETAVGRSFDAGGAGGPLTQVTDQLAKLVQGASEASPATLQKAAAAGAAAALAGTTTLVTAAFNAIRAPSTALLAAAASLEAAALKMSVSGPSSPIPIGHPANPATKFPSVNYGIAGFGLFALIPDMLHDLTTTEKEKMAEFEAHSASLEKLNAAIENWMPDFLKPNKVEAKPKPVDVTGKVSMDPSSHANVSVTVKVEGDGKVTNLKTDGGTGNIRANVGTSSAE